MNAKSNSVVSGFRGSVPGRPVVARVSVPGDIVFTQQVSIRNVTLMEISKFNEPKPKLKLYKKGNVEVEFYGCTLQFVTEFRDF